MAKIVRRKWTSRGPLGERVRHVAFGYALMVNGKRERRWSSAWTTDEEARKALEQRREEIKNGQIAPPHHREVLLGELVEEYLKYKADEGKLTVKDDKNILGNKIAPAFGAHLPMRALDKTMISNYRKRRTAEVSANTIRNELGILHHMLNLAHEWGYLKEVPTIKPRSSRRIESAT